MPTMRVAVVMAVIMAMVWRGAVCTGCAPWQDLPMTVAGLLRGYIVLAAGLRDTP